MANAEESVLSAAKNYTEPSRLNQHLLEWKQFKSSSSPGTNLWFWESLKYGQKGSYFQANGYVVILGNRVIAVFANTYGLYETDDF